MIKIIKNQSGLTIEESIIGEINYAEDSVGFGTKYWNPAAYVAHGDITNIMPRQAHEQHQTASRL